MTKYRLLFILTYEGIKYTGAIMRSLLSVLLASSMFVLPVANYGTDQNKADKLDIDAETNALKAQAPKIKTRTLKNALTAFQHAKDNYHINKNILTVVDYSVPSNQPRMWIFDLNTNKLVMNTYVAHGKGSGGDIPSRFSNENMSKESSLGTYITENTYIGHKGLSLNIKGLEKGFNDQALKRRVVVHGAAYVEPTFIKHTGHAGHSWGCPAVGFSVAKPIINTIKGGSVLFAYYPDKNYLQHSEYLTA